MLWRTPGIKGLRYLRSAAALLILGLAMAACGGGSGMGPEVASADAQSGGTVPHGDERVAQLEALLRFHRVTATGLSLSSLGDQAALAPQAFDLHAPEFALPALLPDTDYSASYALRAGKRVLTALHIGARTPQPEGPRLTPRADERVAKLERRFASANAQQRAELIQEIEMTPAGVDFLARLVDSEGDPATLDNLFSRLAQADAFGARQLVVELLASDDADHALRALRVVDDWWDPTLLPQVRALTEHRSAAVGRLAQTVVENLEIHAHSDGWAGQGTGPMERSAVGLRYERERAQLIDGLDRRINQER